VHRITYKKIIETKKHVFLKFIVFPFHQIFGLVFGSASQFSLIFCGMVVGCRAANFSVKCAVNDGKFAASCFVEGKEWFDSSHWILIVLHCLQQFVCGVLSNFFCELGRKFFCELDSGELFAELAANFLNILRWVQWNRMERSLENAFNIVKFQNLKFPFFFFFF